MNRFLSESLSRFPDTLHGLFEERRCWLDMERELRQVLATSKSDGRDILRKLLRTPSRLASVPEHVARGVLQMPGDRNLSDVP